MSTDKYNISKEDLRDLLLTNIAKIKFTKKDGTERELEVTLNPSIAIYPLRKTNIVRAENDSVLSVWSLENFAWRSIIVANIISIEITTDEP